MSGVTAREEGELLEGGNGIILHLLHRMANGIGLRVKCEDIGQVGKITRKRLAPQLSHVIDSFNITAARVR